MAIVLLEGLGQMKNSMASSKIKSATFRFVMQCLNQLRYCVFPQFESAYFNYFELV
jgi:hypothetical protein